MKYLFRCLFGCATETQKQNLIAKIFEKAFKKLDIDMHKYKQFESHAIAVSDKLQIQVVISRILNFQPSVVRLV